MAKPPPPPAVPRNTGVVIRRLLGLAWRHRVSCLEVILYQIIILALGLLSIKLAGCGIDYIRYCLEPGRLPDLPSFLRDSLRRTNPYIVLGSIGGTMLILTTIRSLLGFRYTGVLGKLILQDLMIPLRAQVYDKLQRLDFRFYDANSNASIINRVTSDVLSLRMFLDQVLIKSIIMIISLVGYSILMINLNVGLAVACLATTPLLWAIATMFSYRIQPSYAHGRKLVDNMLRNLAESVQAVMIIKGFGREFEQRAKFESSNQAIYKQQLNIFWRLSLFTPTIGFLTRINIIILLLYGGWLVMHGRLPLGGGLVVFAALLEQFAGQITNITTIVNGAQQSFTSAQRVFEVLDAPVEIHEPRNAIRRPKIAGSVRFDRVSFGYCDTKAVIRDVNLEVSPGQRVGIFGTTGVGKSTLLSLIPRFYDPDSGRLFIDDVDVRRLGIDDLRRNVGVVFQDNFIFSNTVAANIAFGYPNATAAQIERAARIASAHDFICQLPEGYETLLRENGANLSGGQRQRLALARTILLEPAILLLDDPTAGVDAQTEHEIFDAFDRAMEGRTTFIAAHRFKAMQRVDFIVVMENGQIIQRGTHEELMRLQGPYLRAAKAQFPDASGS